MWFESLFIFILFQFKKCPNISGIRVVKQPFLFEYVQIPVMQSWIFSIITPVFSNYSDQTLKCPLSAVMSTFTLATNNAISKATEDLWTDTFMVLFSYFLQLESPQSPATFILCNIAPSEILQNTFVNHKHLSKWWQNFHCWLNYSLRVYRFYDNAAATWVKESCCTAPWLCTHMNRQRQHHTDSQCYHPPHKQLCFLLVSISDSLNLHLADKDTERVFNAGNFIFASFVIHCLRLVW